MQLIYQQILIKFLLCLVQSARDGKVESGGHGSFSKDSLSGHRIVEITIDSFRPGCLLRPCDFKAR